MTPSDWSPLWISLKTSVAATALTFVFGIAAARAMSAYRGRARGLIDGILTLPLVLPPTVVGFFLLLLFGRRGAFGHALEQIGITVAFSWPATVIAATVVSFPLMYRTALGAFEQVSPNLLGAARTLGAGEWRTFRRVLLPLAGPGITAGTVLAFARALGEFGATLMLAGNIPGRTQTAPVAIFFAAEGGDMHRALLWVLCIVAMSLASITALNYRRTPARITPAPLGDLPAILPMARNTAAPLDLDVVIDKRYPDFHLSVAFSNRGASLGLLGASGSGKSMTLRMIAGLERPDTGRIVLDRRVLFDAAAGVCLSPSERRIGMVFQDHALFPHLTVRQNIAFGLRARTVEEWAQHVRVENLLDRYPAELSGGQQQRVALARALAMDPRALLLDEPFSALDPHLRRQLEEQLRAILGGYSGAVVFVTHDRNEAFRMSEQLVILGEGRVIARGARHDLFAHPESLEAARVTGCKNLVAMGRIDANTAHVDEWGCTLRVESPIPEDAAWLGIRAHHVEIAGHDAENTAPCRLLEVVESPFEVTVYLAVHKGRIEAEMPLERWSAISAMPQPWRIRLDPARLLVLR